MKTIQQSGLKVVCSAATFLLVCLLSQAAMGDGFDLPEGWVPVGDSYPAYHLELSEEAGLDGRGLRIQSREGASGHFGGIAQSIAADDFVGKRVRLRGQVRAIGVSGWAGLWLRVDSEGSSQVLAFDNMSDRPVRGDKDWASYDIVLDVPEGAGSLVFGALLSGQGEIHVDSMELDEVGEDVPLTARPAPRRPQNMSF